MKPKSWQEWKEIIDNKISVGPNFVSKVDGPPPNRVITKKMIDEMPDDPTIKQAVNQTLERIEMALNRLGPLPPKAEKALQKHCKTIYSFMLAGLSYQSVDVWEEEFRWVVKKYLE